MADKKAQAQLQGIVKSLAALIQKVEKLIAQAPAAKAAPKAAAKATAPKKAKARKKAEEQPAADKKLSVLDAVLDAVKRSKNGASVAKLREKTGLSARQLSNALYKLTKKGSIKAEARGIYVKA